MNQNLLGTENIGKLFVKNVIPACIAMVISGLQMMIDGFFLGNYVGYSALASVNLIQPFMQVIMGCSMIVSVGALSYVSRLLGSGENERASSVFRTATLGLAVVSALILLVGAFFSRQLAVMLGSSEMLIEGTASYIQAISLFAPIISLMYLFGFMNRAMGKPNLYLRATVFSVAINVVLDFLFIKTWGLGIRGAAVATGIAFLVAFVIVLVPMVDRRNILNLFHGRIVISELMPMLYNGASEGIVALSSGVSIYLFNTAFMHSVGETGVAALAIINYITQFGILILFGISDGITTIVSYNYGSMKHERVRKTLRMAIVSGLVLGGLFFICLMFFSGDIIKLFGSDNAEILIITRQGAMIYAVAFLFNGTNIILSGYFTALGNAKTSVILSASRGLIYVVIGINLLPIYFGMTGIWMTVPIAEVMTFLTCLCFMSRHRHGMAVSTSVEAQ